MTDLLTRLQDASEGSREMDRAIADHVHGKPKPPYVRGYVCNYTTSMDAALTLVPEGWQWNIDNGIHCEDAAHAWLGNNSPQEIVPGTSGDAATPALALCIAALKAQESKAEAAPFNSGGHPCPPTW